MFLNVGFAQNCLQYYPYGQDAQFTLETYNKKDKLEGRIEYKVVEVTDDHITYHATFYDKKGEMTTEMTFDIVCEDGLAKIDMRNFMPQSNLEQMQGMESMEVELEGDAMEFPKALTVGQTLPDASMTMKASVDGMGSVMSTTINITDRKIEGKESVTVPYGTYECYRITQTSNVKMSFVNSTSTTVTYVHPEKGFLKSETFNKKGKLQSYTVRAK